MAKRQRVSKALPRITSRTITVRSLIRTIQQIVRTEPLRLNMNAFVSAFGGKRVHKREAKQLPACGTVACIAGWGAVLLRPDHVSAKSLADRAECVMEELLGHPSEWDNDYMTVGDLFVSDCSTYDDSAEYFDLWPAPGTTEHAQWVVARLNRYMNAHPEILGRKIDVEKARLMLANND